MKHWHMYSTGELWKHAKWNKPNPKDRELCDSIYIRYLEWEKILETENSLGDGGKKEFCDSSFGW